MDTNKIAEEAANKIEQLIERHGVKGFRLDLVIQSAIDKATKNCERDRNHLAMVVSEMQKERDSRAAHASEPWKYDIDGTDGYIRIHPMHNPEITLFWITELAQAKKCVNAHNQCRAAHASSNWAKCPICGHEHDLVNDVVHPVTHASEPSIAAQHMEPYEREAEELRALAQASELTIEEIVELRKPAHAREQEKAAERVREAYRCEKCGAVHDGGAHASDDYDNKNRR